MKEKIFPLSRSQDPSKSIYTRTVLESQKVSGTKSNDDFSKYQTETNFYVEMSKIQREISSVTIEESDIFKRDSNIINDLRDQFDLMRSKLNNYEISFMSKNNDSYISALILERMVVQQEIDTRLHN